MTAAATTAAPVAIAAKPGRTRLIQAACFGVGAVALAVVVGGGTLSFLWTPAILGLTYLAAAIAGGRDGGHWSTACVLLGWGAGVLSASEGLVGLGAAPLYLAGAGLGGVVAAILERRGFSADLLGVAGTITLAGVVFGLAGDVELLVQAETYAAALAVVATVNIALALRAP